MTCEPPKPFVLVCAVFTAVTALGEEDLCIGSRVPLADHQGVALRPDDLIDHAGRLRPWDIAQGGLVQRSQDAVELVLTTHGNFCFQ